MSAPKMANQNTKAPPYPKIKYSDDKFRELIPNLPLIECLKVEYRSKGVWFKMISKRNNSHNCECCGIINVGLTPIVDHIRGKKHRIALQAADKLFHPQYTAPRPTNSPARTPLLDVYLSREGLAPEKPGSGQKPGGPASAQKPAGPASAQKPAVPASAQKPEGPDSAQKPGPDSAQRPGPASAQKPGPASAQKPGPASAQKPGPASAQKPGPASAQKPGPASAQKPGPASAQKPGPASAQKPGPASVRKPGPASAQKPGPASAQKSNQEGAAAEQPKTSATQKPGPASSKKPAQPDKTEPKVNASPAVSASAASESKGTSDKNKGETTTNKPDNNKRNEEVILKANRDPSPEIVVLDDDDDDDIPTQQKPSPNNSNTQNNSQKDNTVGKAIPVAGTAVPKGQRANRRIVNPHAIMQQHKNIEQEAKKVQNAIPNANRVINPAAVLAQNAEKKDDENTPRYQQNRVIIPTNNRKRGPQNQESGEQQQQQQQQQNFATKSFSPRTSGDQEGIIGVEYVVKILKVYNDPEPFYECCLCEVVMDGVGMQTHLLGYNHRYKYIEKHFPTVFNQFKEHIGNIQVMGIIMDRLAKAIEAHHGRELPYECLSGEFRSNRHGVMTTVYSFRHASEYSGPSFTNIMDAKEVAELYNNKVMYNPPKVDPKRKPTFDTRSTGAPAAKKVRIERRERERERERPMPHMPRPNMGRGGEMGGPHPNMGRGGRPYRGEPPLEANNTIDDATHKLMVEEFLQNTRGRSRSPGGRRRRHRSRSRSPHRSHRRDTRRSPSPLREGDIWQAYRHLVDRSKSELDQMYREYRNDPEKHPVYDEEWRKFWKHRKDQLAREGLDHRNYDFQPEWVRFFAVRIEELYEEAVEDIKISSRRRLILPMTNDELQDKKYHIKTVVKNDAEQPKMQQQNKSGHISFPDTTGNTSVVGVLRLLTALEDYLGSLGPKVVDLLSKALLVEKTNPREINDIILNLENCTILETAMEKLKGVLIAGLLEGPKVRAFNNVITETDKILRVAYKIKQQNPQPQVVTKTHPQPVPAPRNQKQDFQRKSFSPPPMGRNSGGGGGVGSGGGGNVGGGNVGGGNAASSGAAASLLSQIDKKELATKLAAALTAQGKTDFNPEQLQQLIAVYSLIDKKKRDSAAATDKQKMTLSDTLTALLNPSSGKGGDPDRNSPQPLLSIRTTGGGGGGESGGNHSNNNDKFGSINNSSISNLVNMLNRDSGSTGGSGNGGDSEMWHNLQNIQSSLRSQNNNSSSNADAGFGNSSANAGRAGFGNNQMGGGGGQGGVGGGGGGNFNRGGFGDSSGNDFNSDRNLNRGGNRGDDGLDSGFRTGFQSMNNSNPSRMGGNDDNMIAGGRGINDTMGSGGRGGNDMISRGRVGNNMMGGGNDMMSGGRSGGNNSFPGGNNMGFGGSNFSRTGMSGMGGANNTLGFSRSSFLGSGNLGNAYSNFSGLSNFSTSISLDNANNILSRSSSGAMGGGAGGSSFNRGNISGLSSFGMNTSNFNNQANKNMSGPTFSSAPNQRNMGGGNPAGGGNNNSTQAVRSGGGSNWRNQ